MQTIIADSSPHGIKLFGFNSLPNTGPLLLVAGKSRSGKAIYNNIPIYVLSISNVPKPMTVDRTLHGHGCQNIVSNPTTATMTATSRGFGVQGLGRLLPAIWPLDPEGYNRSTRDYSIHPKLVKLVHTSISQKQKLHPQNLDPPLNSLHGDRNHAALYTPCKCLILSQNGKKKYVQPPILCKKHQKPSNFYPKPLECLNPNPETLNPQNYAPSACKSRGIASATRPPALAGVGFCGFSSLNPKPLNP